ncbi:MAG TPA: SBBP repeat-containing protein [Bryobacteraceae bacterium]|nr:SBBP repeat-containing protein [Bryobacteraceae bacterium]
MVVRTVFLGLFAVSLAFPQNPLSDLTLGGTGVTSIHGTAVDPAGNLYVVGTTYSSDLPLQNPFQSVNRGTQVVYSTDSGATWKPLVSPFPPAAYPNFQIAVDPANASVVYASSGPTLCKSVDGGSHFQCSNLSFLTFSGINSLVFAPRNSSTIYLSAGEPGGLYKSTDGGQTWNPAGQGLPNTEFQFAVSIDPFHSNVVFVWTGSGGGYVSHDGAATWAPSTLPYPPGVMMGETFYGFFFDAATPGVVYGPGRNGDFTLQRSTDGGQTWTELTVPFSSPSFFGPDPQAAGKLYALGHSGSNGPLALWTSMDQGGSWVPTSVPQGLTGPLSFDPHNPQIILSDYYGNGPAFSPSTYRSTDGGKTWAVANPRILLPVFAPSAAGMVYAIGASSSDAFLAKFLPDGKTLLFATYLGGVADDTGNALALDPSGNIWIAGTTYSADFPATSGAFQPTLKGQVNGFLAKFTGDGNLIAATYLGGSSQDAILGLAVGPQGNPWVVGNWSSRDFPFTTAAPPVVSPPTSYLAELDPAGAQVLVAMTLGGQVDNNGNGIAVDGSGNAIITGTTTDVNFPATVQPLTVDVSPRAKAFVQKFDPSGKTIYATSFGGFHGPPIVGKSIGLGGFGSEQEEDHGVAVALDSAGNAYIAGYTSATDFPVTPGAYQTKLADACPYAAFEIDTGLIGVISEFYMDDSFVVKLSPDGTTALYSTLVGGQCFDHPTAIAVDASGRAVITGETDSFDYPLVAPVEAAPSYSDFASFLSVLDPTGSTLDFSTYLYAGASPFVAVQNTGAIDVGGSTGGGAQTSPISGAYFTPDPTMHGYLAVVTPPATVPPVNLARVLNAFSLLPGPVSPGEILSVSVPGFAPNPPVDIGLNLQGGPLAASLAGVQVSFDGIAAYIVSALPGKIVCIAPVEIAGQSTTATQVTINGLSSNVLDVNVAPTDLGLLSADGSGAGQAYALNADGSMNSPSNPAAIGSQVTVFFTGGGVTNPPEADGTSPATAGAVPAAKLPLYPLGGSIQALPGYAPGMFSYTFTVPANGPSPLTVFTQATTDETQYLLVSIH